MRYRILISDDEVDIVEMLTGFFRGKGYEVFSAYNGVETLKLAELQPDIILLDINMPKLDGIEVCKKIRDYVSCPILFLTARIEENDKVQGFSVGGDDYIVKPFLPKELIYRVNAILRRSYKGENPIVKLSGSEIDFDRAEVIKNGEHIALTAKEYDILAALYRNAGRIVTLDALCEAAWGDNPYGYENSLMTHIRRIREKIEVNPSQPVSLITIKGLGYKLIVGDK